MAPATCVSTVMATLISPLRAARTAPARATVPAARLAPVTAGIPAAEGRIARRLAQGDPRGLEQLHDLTARAAFSVVNAIVRDRGHAEDVHQQVYAEVWRRASQYDPARGTLLTWVLTIARSRALDHLRRRADQPVEGETLAVLQGGADDRAYDEIIERAHVGEALAQLPAQERELLRLRFWDGLSQTEIAERTGQPLGTVKSRMTSGLRAMREQLAAQGVST